jgi:hypothetical protein
MTRDASFKRQVRARMAKTRERYTTALAHLERGARAARQGDRVLTVTNGDSVAGTLREAGVTGPILPWRDVLHDGPVPGGLAPGELRRVRALHLAARGWGEADALERDLHARDRLLADHAGGAYVLWFEADLYDQLQLVQVLDALVSSGVRPERVTLVSAGEHPGSAHFGGLGELTAAQLASLAGQGVPLTTEALELARAAWAAFTAPEPTGLPAVAGTRSPVLRFLGEAFARLLAEYPSRSDGLSLTHRRILIAAAAAAADATAGQVFRRVWQAELRPFLADAPCYACIRDLAGCPAPLLAIEPGEGPFHERGIRLTPLGRRVLAGDEDHVRHGGVERWIGGVRLAAGSSPARYDERLETLIPGAS